MGLTILPNTGQTLDETRDDIKLNFNTINSEFQRDHIEWNTGTNAGKHKRVRMPENTSAGATAVDEMMVYCNNYTTTSQSELFLKRENVASGSAGIPFTAFDGSGNGWTYLPSGILLKWGSSTADGDTSLVVSHGPNFNTVITAFITTSDSSSGDIDGFVRLRNVALTGVAPNTATLTTYGAKRTTSGAAGSNIGFRYLIIGT